MSSASSRRAARSGWTPSADAIASTCGLPTTDVASEDAEASAAGASPPSAAVAASPPSAPSDAAGAASGAASAGGCGAGAVARAAAALRRVRVENSVSVFMGACYTKPPADASPADPRSSADQAPPPTEPLAWAETDTDTETFASMWPIMFAAAAI